MDKWQQLNVIMVNIIIYINNNNIQYTFDNIISD